MGRQSEKEGTKFFTFYRLIQDSQFKIQNALSDWLCRSGYVTLATCAFATSFLFIPAEFIAENNQYDAGILCTSLYSLYSMSSLHSLSLH
jgi:hypothetical protein